MLSPNLTGSVLKGKDFVRFSFNNGDQVSIRKVKSGPKLIRNVFLTYLKIKNYKFLCPKCKNSMSIDTKLPSNVSFSFVCSHCKHSVTITKK